MLATLVAFAVLAIGDAAAVSNGKIVFVSERDGNPEIYVMNADGSGQTRLTSNTAADYGPAWSWDGTKIAFTSDRDGGNPEIYVMNADGTGQTRVTNNTVWDSHPNWHPNGTKLAFLSSRGGNDDIYAINADGTGEVRLTDHFTSDLNPAWSPDGTKIAFDSYRDGNAEIYVMNADGSTQLRFTNDPAADFGVNWSSDGAKLIWAKANRTAIAQYPGGVLLAHFTATSLRPDFSPDGARVVYEGGPSPEEIYTATPDGSAVVRLTENAHREYEADWQPLGFVPPATTERVSVSSDEGEATGPSARPSVSAGGRYVAFESAAPNLAPGDNDDFSDVFVRDRELGTTTLVSAGAGGAEPNAGSWEPSISGDGRYVAFASRATNLGPDVPAGRTQIYVRDLQTGVTTLASVRDGTPGNADSFAPSIARDGRNVVFSSRATNLDTVTDTNGATDVFRYDRVTGHIELASRVPGGAAAGNGQSDDPVISADGRYVAFWSEASNLVDGDGNLVADVFRRDLVSGQTILVSSGETPANGESGFDGEHPTVAISDNGTRIAYASNASNLVAGDTNGSPDVFLWKADAGTVLVSRAPDGPAAGNSAAPVLSASGDHVAFLSDAEDLVPGDTNGYVDAFVRNVTLGTTVRASLGADGAQGTASVQTLGLSGDGMFAAFSSGASNLVPGDTNLREDVFVRRLIPAPGGGPGGGGTLTTTVNSTNDSDDGACTTAHCSLREAINAANAQPGLQTIGFAIGTGKQTIRPASPLPALTGPTVVDGTTQPGYAGKPLIELDGSVAGNGHGLEVAGGSTVRGLVVNRFQRTGLVLLGTGSKVEGTWVGVEGSGILGAPNGQGGIKLTGANHQVGGSTPAQRNVVSGHTGGLVPWGIFVQASHSTIAGNRIGTTADGTGDLGNDIGILVSAGSLRIGGGTPADANLVSGNNIAGISLYDPESLAEGTRIEGNVVGLTASGAARLPNVVGIRIESGVRNTVIESNTIAGNTQDGIRIVNPSPGVDIVSNRIGTNSGGANLGNFGSGVYVLADVAPPDVVVRDGNEIRFNGAGITVTGMRANVSIRGNRIDRNNALGIDIGPTGPNPNDPQDEDGGPNRMQNAPDRPVPSREGTGTRVVGAISTEPNATVLVDVYWSHACDASGFGEGRTHLATLTVTTNGEGAGTYDQVLAVPVPVAAVVTATATLAGSTSEFSACGVVAGTPDPGLLKVVSVAGIDSLDTVLAYQTPSWQLLRATCAGLLRYDDSAGGRSATLVPEVATAMPAVSNGGRTYEFTLRNDFRFAPGGEPLDAEAFERAFERMFAPGSASPGRYLFDVIDGAGEYHSGDASSISGIAASGTTLRITLDAPAGDLPARLATPFACAVPPGTPDEAQRSLPAAGPYYVASYEPGSAVTFLRNPDYPGSQSRNFDSIEYVIVESYADAVARVESGAADYVTSLLPADRTRLRPLFGPGSPAAGEGKQRYYEGPAAVTWWVAMNTSRLTSPLLRRAIARVVPRAAMAAVFGGDATDQLRPPVLDDYGERDLWPLEPTADDVARSTADVQAADATGSTIHLYSCTFAGSACGPEVAELLRARLVQIGLQVQVHAFPRGEQIQRVRNPGEPFDLTLDGWGADYADGYNFLGPLFTTAALPPGARGHNIHRFSDPYWDARIAAIQEQSGQQRADALTSAEADLLAGPAPAAPYANSRIAVLTSERIGCHRLNTIFGLNLQELCVRVPVTAAVALEAVPAQVPAGVAAVPLSALSPTELQLDFGSGLASAPLHGTPLHDTPLHDTPLHDTPLHDIPLHDTGLLLPGVREALRQVPLSSIPLRLPGGWDAVLAGTVLAVKPLQAVTLADVLALQPLPEAIRPPAGSKVQAVSLGDLDPSGGIFASLTVEAAALGGTTLDQVRIRGASPDALTNWCSALAGPPISCKPSSAGGLQGTSIVGLALSGVPLHDTPLHDTPLHDIDISAAPLHDIPLHDTNLALSPLHDTPLRPALLTQTPLHDIPLHDIPLHDTATERSPLHDIPLHDTSNPQGIVSCGAGAACPLGLTLGQLATQGRLLGTATLADVGVNALVLYVLGDLRAYGETTLGDIWPYIGELTLGDLLRALVPLSDYPWESLNLGALPLQQLGTGGTAEFVAQLQLTGTGVPPGRRYATRVDVRIPDGFAYVEGSARLRQVATGHEQPLADPALAGGTASFPLSVTANEAHEVRFRARASLELGLSTPSTAGLKTDGGATAQSSQVSLQVGDTFEPNDTIGQAAPIAPDTLIFGFISSGDDEDYYSLPAPPPGSRITFSLSHLSSDADLVVYAPNQPALRPGEPLRAPSPGAPLADDGVPLASETATLQPERLQDVALVPGRQVAGISINTGTNDEHVSDVSQYAGGSYAIRVGPFNREQSNRAYVLRVQVTPPPAELECEWPVFQTAFAGVHGTLPSPLPSGLDTVFLVNRKRLGDTYGAAAETALTQMAAQLPQLGALGHPAAILEVEGDPDVAAAYGAWDANPCSAAGANGVVRAIGALVDRLRVQSPGLRNIVLVGGDRIVPFARLRDGTSLANESEFAAELPEGSSTRGALAAENVLSDDPYSATGVLDAARPLYLPALAVGRLVETPGEIAAAVEQFVLFGGRLDPATKHAVTSGYDFLRDGARAIHPELTAMSATSQLLDSPNWDRAQLEAALLGPTPPWLASVNAHFDPSRALPANEDAANTQNDLFTTEHIRNAPATALVGSVLFSMGCHAGLSLEDVVIGTPYADWAQTLNGRRASLVGNTGYGYGDSDVVAYSEELMRRFAVELRAGRTLGLALVAAKQRYFASLAVSGVYDEKVLNIATLYGLPMYELAPGPTVARMAAAAAVTPSATDPATGLPVHRVDFRPSLTETGPAPRLLRRDTPRGSYWHVDEETLVVHFRPIQPQYSIDVTSSNPSLVAHGAVVTAATSNDTAADPVFARPVIDLTAREGEIAFGEVSFPSKIQALGSFEIAGTRGQQLNIVPGQFFKGTGTSQGTQRLFTRLDLDVLYSTSSDFAPPELSRIEGSIVGSTAAFSVCAEDSNAVRRVLVLYRDGTQAAWRRVELVRTPGTCLWTGAGPADGDRVEYFVQAVDAAGNVGVSTYKARYYDAVPAPPPPAGIRVTVGGTPDASGWHTAATEVTLEATDGSAMEYAVNGGPLRPYTGPIGLGTTGVHTIDYASASGVTGSQVVAVDVTPPAVELDVPAEGAVYEVGEVVHAGFRCADAGSGVASCTGTVADGAAIDTTPGEKTFTVVARDRTGRETSVTRTYRAAWPFTGFVGLRPPPATTTVTAGQAIPLLFRLGGNRGLDVLAPGYPRSEAIPCGSNARTEGEQPAQTPGNVGLKFVAGHYVYLWKTDKAWRGTCRQFVLGLRDGSFHRVNVRFRAAGRDDD